MFWLPEEPVLTNEMIINQTIKYYYVYTLMSEKDGKKYTGFTTDLSLRFEAHQKGEVAATLYRNPFKIIYF